MDIEKIQPSGIFTNYIYKTIPLAFDESMSYYETLCGVLKLLKTQEEVVNHNADLLAELEEYVNHYFDNLNIQEEVNNKLDDMVTSGTLAEIINQQIFGELNNKVDNAIQTEIDDYASLVKFNNYTNKPLKYGELNLPSEFNHYNFDLIRKIDNTIDDNLDLSVYDTNNKLYVDRDNGNDSNDGAEATPFKTIKGALNAITSLTGNNWKIICKSYRFFRNEFVGETTQTEEYTMYKNIVIEPYDPTQKILVTTAQETLVWTSDGNNVYHATRSSINKVFDMTEKDVYGVYKQVPKVDTLTDCQNTPNTYYISGSTIYMHTKGGEPSNSTYIINLALSTGQFNIRGNLWLHLKNIDFYVSGAMSFHNSSSYYNNALICENVGIYGCGDNNGFSINNVKNVYMINCKTGYNLRDGFNYHFTQMPSNDISNSIVYEKNSMSFENGINDTNTNNNCSTIHNGANIIRVNNIYKNSRGPAVADIESSKTLMINCGITQENNYNAFAFEDSTTGEGKAYLIDCNSVQQNTLSLTGTDDFVIKLKNFHGNYENEDLNISLYNE